MSSSRSYVILHIDVYQGGNKCDIGIHETFQGLQTTIKAVTNAAHNIVLHQYESGMNHLSMDNIYQCPHLEIILREKYNCYITGTVRMNRKGLPDDDVMGDIGKESGSYFLMYDCENHVSFGKWVDTETVSFISTLNNPIITVIKRQVVNDKK